VYTRTIFTGKWYLGAQYFSVNCINNKNKQQQNFIYKKKTNILYITNTHARYLLINIQFPGA